MHQTAIVLHAATGTLCFASAVMLLVRLRDRASQNRWFWAYGLSLGLLILYMGAAIVSEWSEHSPLERITFPALFMLALYMAYRARAAVRVWRSAQPGWQRPFIDHIGFNLIAMVDALVIISAVDRHAPGWAITGLAALGVIIGIQVMERVKVRAIDKPA